MRFKIEWATLLFGSKFTVFALFYFVFEGNFSSTSPRGAYIWRGDLTESFLRYPFGGLIFGGAYFRNFTVGYAQFLGATDVYLPGKCASVEFPRKRTLNSVLFLPVETCPLNTAQ